jgi:uncharacterized protein
VIFRILTGLVIGALGGLIFARLGVPAPWIAGSMTAAIIAVAFRFELHLTELLKSLAFILLGIQTGMTVTKETIDRAAQWPLSILMLALTVALIVWVSFQYFVRVRKWDAATALFASLPGALSLVILLATETTADMRKVVIAQCIRLFFLIIAMPSVIVLLSPPMTPAGATLVAHGFDLVLVVAAAGGFGVLLHMLRVPAGLVLGATLASAALGLSGIVVGAAPDIILIPANIILGVMIALRFKGMGLAELRRNLFDGMTGLIIAVVLAAIGALLTSAVTGLPRALTLLAFAPGGLEAMTIMSFALKLDPAYVAAHQVSRYIGLVLVMPGITRFVLQRVGDHARLSSPGANQRLED